MPVRLPVRALCAAVVATALVAAAGAAGALVDPGSGTTYETARVVVPMTFPVVGATSVTDTFLSCRSGCDRMHMGQDLMGAKMSPVVAAFDGVVSTMRLDSGSAGNYLGITAERGPAAGWTVLYLHLNNDTPGTDDGRGTATWSVAPGLGVGARVVAGQLVGWRGDSGNAEDTGPHVHLELRKGTGWGGTVYNAYPSLLAARRLAAPLPSGPHPSGTLLRHPTGRLFVVDGAAKRPVSAGVLAANALPVASAVPMTAAESLGYPTWPALPLRDGTVAAAPDGGLWLVTGGARAAVTRTELATLGRPAPRVWPVSDEELGALPTGPLPATPYYPGALVRVEGTPEVRYVDSGGVLRPVDGPTMASFGWTYADVAVVAAPGNPPAAAHRTRAEAAPTDQPSPSGPAYGAPLPLRDGTLVQTRAPAVGVVAGGAFRQIRDARMLAAYGYAGRPRLLLPHAVVAALPTALLTAR